MTYSFDDFFTNIFDFIINIVLSISEFVINNKIVFYFVFVPILASCFIVFIDMLFDIRDLFGDVSKPHDYLPYTKLKLYNKYIKPKKKNFVDMENVYTRSRELADYKHNLKVKEMNMYKENEQLRHSHKIEEQDNFYKNKQAHDLKIKNMQNALNKHSIPKHSNNKKVNLDVEFED